MSDTKTAKNSKKNSVQIIVVGVPKLVIHVINLLHLLKFANAGDWIEVNRNRATNQQTMTITLDFML